MQHCICLEVYIPKKGALEKASNNFEAFAACPRQPFHPGQRPKRPNSQTSAWACRHYTQLAAAAPSVIDLPIRRLKQELSGRPNWVWRLLESPVCKYTSDGLEQGNMNVVLRQLRTHSVQAAHTLCMSIQVYSGQVRSGLLCRQRNNHVATKSLFPPACWELA